MEQEGRGVTASTHAKKARGVACLVESFVRRHRHRARVRGEERARVRVGRWCLLLTRVITPTSPGETVRDLNFTLLRLRQTGSNRLST